MHLYCNFLPNHFAILYYTVAVFDEKRQKGQINIVAVFNLLLYYLHSA